MKSARWLWPVFFFLGGSLAVVAEDASPRHWAFQAPVDPVVPATRDKAWPQTPLDRFILSALEAKGLRPAARANKRDLLRRVTFDLIGLPPTLEEIESFLADESPNAFARVVDRLLASPHYGERWGRHWLDVARYADSNGLDENIAHGNAWRYRDYVVAAINRDKPFDQFIMEQIAGDLMPASDNKSRIEHLVATGFLALGPKVLAEVDEKKMELDIVDEQIDTVGQAFLGLTLGCARCHDHKFDPISLEDYYGLVGIFQSTKTMDSFKKIAKWHENLIGDESQLARQADYEQKISQLKQAIDKLRAQPNAPAGELKRMRDELAKLEKSPPDVPTAMGVMEGETVNAALLRRGNHLKPGKTIARRFPVVLAGGSQSALDSGHSGRLELARWLARKGHPLTSRVMVNRIWRWHFGQGLVRSVDNFGLLAEAPSHPALLDWLACRFEESGWSIKAMHRLILLSSTYQTSSWADARTVAADPDNRFLARTSIRRLEAEEIRDSLLAVSGQLDRQMGGSLLVHVKNREFLFDHTSKDQTKYDSHRRALYLPIIRNNLYDVFQLFDSTDATILSGNRAQTTVATQALFLMNSDLVIQAAERSVARLLERKDLSNDQRLQVLYQTAYGRLATSNELGRARQAIAEFERSLGGQRLQAWAFFGQTLLAANEFVYLN